MESYISMADIVGKVDGHAPDVEKFISHGKQIEAHIAETEKKQCEAKKAHHETERAPAEWEISVHIVRRDDYGWFEKM